jgi:hypothetical protein
MNCPTCGAPNVMLHKDIWECGWCGDSGFIPQRIQDARRAAKTVRIPKEITLTLTVEPGENEDTPEQPIFFDSAVERIVEHFPELKDEYESEALSGMMGAQLLEEVYRTDPQKAIAMWRSLPEKQEPLQDPRRAEDFFYLLDFLWEHEDYNEDVLAPLLDAVRKDDTLAEMVFRSHYVCKLHLYLIQAAFEQRKTELAEHLYALLQSNPLPREEWCEDPNKFQAAMEGNHTSQPKDTTVYHYCSVQVGNSRPYAYLTAGLPVKRGDLVRVPYGKKNEPKEGIVRSVGDYTHDTAPWSPEKAKRVLEILPKPQVSVKKESTVPKPQQEHTKPEEPAHSAAPAPAGAVQDATRPTRKYGRIAIIVICFVLVGWLIFLAAQDVPKAQPAAVAPAASRTDSSSIATTPTASYAQYSGKLPVEGMPMKALSYTSLGAPDKELKCKNFEKLEPNRKYINVYWYDDSGELIAAGMCAQWEGDSEFVLKSFSQYYPTQPYEGQTFHSGSATDTGSGSGQSLREDYGDPEDLYEDGDYDDLDEAWDEWEEGW